MGYTSPESVSEIVILSQSYTEFTQFDWNIKINECPPWGNTTIKRNGKKYPIDCGQIYNDIYPNKCE